jgi:hypothetical protein
VAPREDTGTSELTISPAQFLRDVVAPRFAQRIEAMRARIAGLQHEIDDRLRAEGSIRLQITGQGGGTWYLNFRDGRMEVGATGVHPLVLTVLQTYEDWLVIARAAGAGSRDATDPGPPRGTVDLTRTRVERLRRITGTVRIVLTDAPGGVERGVTLHLGPGEAAPAPQATVTMREADARRLREGALTPQAAFLQGLVKITGDMGIAVQLGTALFM